MSHSDDWVFGIIDCFLKSKDEEHRDWGAKANAHVLKILQEAAEHEKGSSSLIRDLPDLNYIYHALLLELFTNMNKYYVPKSKKKSKQKPQNIIRGIVEDFENNVDKYVYNNPKMSESVKQKFRENMTHGGILGQLSGLKILFRE